MRNVDEWLGPLRRQANRLDRLDQYLAACRRRGISDELALEERNQAARRYRHDLSRLPVDLLLLYGQETAQARRS